jgi:putative oxidoreductase
MSSTLASPAFAFPGTARLQALGTTLLRVTLGGWTMTHGAIKLFVFTPAGTEAYFAALGLSGAIGLLTIAAELAGGLALLLGAGTRFVALAFVPLLFGTIVLVHGHNGFLFSAPGGGWEFPAFWIAALLAQALLGDGAFALRRTR